MTRVHINHFLNPDGLCYSLCGFCGATIPKMEDARWVDIGVKWNQISCTECADKHDEDKVSCVELPHEVKEMVVTDNTADTLRAQIRELQKVKLEIINGIIIDEGIEKGLLIYHTVTPYIVTSWVNSRTSSDVSVDVIMHPVTKAGRASKINKTTMSWNDFIRLWRLQRADQEAYVERCKVRNKKMKERYKNLKITPDMV